MASTGNTFPGTGGSVTRGTGVAWTAPGEIVSDNATDATCVGTVGNGSAYLVARNFNWNGGAGIPAGAIILGVLARTEASEHSGGTEPLLAQLQDASAALIGSAKTNTNEGDISGTAKAVYTHGSASDVWGASLTAAMLNDADFGVRFWFTTAHDIRIDFVTLNVTYQQRGQVTKSVQSAIALPSEVTKSVTTT